MSLNSHLLSITSCQWMFMGQSGGWCAPTQRGLSFTKPVSDTEASLYLHCHHHSFKTALNFSHKCHFVKYLTFQVPPDLDQDEIRTKLGLKKSKVELNKKTILV